jgi:hypothetical protein
MTYDYALLLGGLYQRVVYRLQYLIDLWNQGIRFKHIILLGSERPLNEGVEPLDSILDPDPTKISLRPGWIAPSAEKVKTEMDIMKIAYDQLDMPSDMRAIPAVFSNTPMQLMTDGSQRRPTTSDTIKTWLSTNPKPGSCLVISSQPHVGYQDAVVRTYLPTDFTVDTVGTASKTTVYTQKCGEYLDAIARWLYQEAELRK